MKYIISQLADIFHFTVKMIKATNTLFCSAIEISYFIGHCIVAACVHVLERVYVALQLLYSVASILYEDYCFFVVDLITKVKWTFSGFHYVFNSVCIFIQQVITALKNLFDSIIYFLSSNMEFLITLVNKGGCSLCYGLELVKQALILIGNSIWYFISIIPVSIMYGVTIILCYVSETFLEFYFALINTCHAMISAPQKLIQFFSDIPIEAAIGLFLGFIALCFLVRKINGDLLIQSTVYIVCTVIEVFFFLKEALTYPFTSSRNRVDIRTPEYTVINNQEGNPIITCGSSLCTAITCDCDLTSKLCVVCQDKEKTVIVLPCRHVCLCLVCCTIIEEQYGKCPVCRRRVERTMTVYI